MKKQIKSSIDLFFNPNQGIYKNRLEILNFPQLPFWKIIEWEFSKNVLSFYFYKYLDPKEMESLK